jgi:hypothetical protein
VCIRAIAPARRDDRDEQAGRPHGGTTPRWTGWWSSGRSARRGGAFRGPAGGPAHLLHNPYDEDLVYLAGGERREFDVIDSPQAGRRLVRIGGESTLYPAQSGEPLFGRGGRETVTAEP